ncbi:Arginine decarboxylase [Porphyridium purpureum]|uniref:Arginine decarboxylase n=1 Tax=Porphyridium purpureum TaxID=35688 RepID=A0A5J4Z055_PORPP|nr:Arginine decarboxylase [Porphyridium purpureum]|eukprot:POR5088..scf208_2
MKAAFANSACAARRSAKLRSATVQCCTVAPASSEPEPGQDELPILSALRAESKRVRAAFFCPGHRLGVGIAAPFKEALRGHGGMQLDLPELPDFDNLFEPYGPIARAESLATKLFCRDARDGEAYRTFFLVNGSTSGVLASLLALPRLANGRRNVVMLPRNAHQSVIYGCVLAGVEPWFIEPEYDGVLDVLHGFTPQKVRGALLAQPDRAKNVAAILVVSPTYYGVGSDLDELRMIADEMDALLIVDEAHGAHLPFFGPEERRTKNTSLPRSAVSCGADMIIQSTHKTLSSMSQTAMLHARVKLEQPLAASLRMVQSSSPNALLLASLDAARWKMANKAPLGLIDALHLAEQARQRLESIKGVSVLRRPSQFPYMDTLRVTVCLHDAPIDGFELDEMLIERGVYAELPTMNAMLFIVTDATTQQDIDILVDGVENAMAEAFSAKLTDSPSTKSDSIPLPPQSAFGELAMLPREAFLGPSEGTPLVASAGRVSSATVCPYPPGIPVLLPGERITADCIQYLEAIVERGGTITGLSDGQVQVVALAAST